MQRVVLVTGAASGIGAAVCRALAAPGVALLVHTRRNRAEAERVAAEARTAGAVAEIALGDLLTRLWRAIWWRRLSQNSADWTC